MKRIHILYLIVGLFLTSCGKSFLDSENPAIIFSNGFYKDSASVASGVIGVYNSLQEIYGSGATGLFLIGDVATDNSYSLVTSVPNWDPLLIDATDLSNRALWISTYKCIGRANDVITNAASVTMNESAKTRLISEVKFIRALCYFNAVRIWGKVPLVTKPFSEPADAYVDGRSEIGDIYNLIIQDLTDAYGGLPDFYAQYNVNSGRATKAATIALWGEALLTQKKFPDAVNKLSEIVTSEAKYGVSLAADYLRIFSTDNEMNGEILFAVRYTSGQTPNSLGSSFNNQFMPIGSDQPGANQLSKTSTYSGNLIHADLRDAFEAGDKRKQASLDSFSRSGSYVMYTKKFLNGNNTITNDGSNDWIVYRYADVLLMYAEALNESGQSNQANNIITRVRQRAGLGALTFSDQADLRSKILRERRVELNMEGKRWFDLLRSNNLIAVMNNYLTKYNLRGSAGALESFRVLFPVPYTEIQTNPKLLPNNDGY